MNRQYWGTSEVFTWNSTQPTHDSPKLLVNLHFREPTMVAVSSEVPDVPERLVKRDSLFALLKFQIGIGQFSRTEYWEPQDCRRNVLCTDLSVSVHNRVAVLPRTQSGLLDWGFPGDPIRDFWALGENRTTINCWAAIGAHSQQCSHLAYTIPYDAIGGSPIFGVIPPFTTHLGLNGNTSGVMFTGSAELRLKRAANLTFARQYIVLNSERLAGSLQMREEHPPALSVPVESLIELPPGLRVLEYRLDGDPQAPTATAADFAQFLFIAR